MATSKGWEASIQYDATIIKEKIGTGDGSTTTFYTYQFPVVSSSTYATTDDENDVTVYIDDEAQGAATFTLTGASGRIVFGTAPSSNEVVTITYTYRKVVGYARDIAFTVEHGVEGVFPIGSRPAKELKEGQCKTTGHTSEYWVDRTLMGKAIGVNATSQQNQFTATIKNSSTGTTFTLTGVKFSAWAYDSTNDGFTGNNADFIVSGISKA